MGKFGTGQAIRRVEDQRFLTGTGRYLDDVAPADAAVLYFLRSPFPHGVISELDLDEARGAPGVLGVYTAADLAEAGFGDLPGSAVPKSAGHPGHAAVRQPPLAREVVRYVGEPVVAVVAETLAAAKDAAELILFDVDELPAVTDLADALADGAPRVHDDVDGNLLGVMTHGDASATDESFAGAERVIELDLVNNRLAPTAMEPRGCVAVYDDGEDAYTLYQGCQGVHNLRRHVSAATGIPEERLRVVSPDVGGGFGLKMFLQCETVAALHAAKELGRPVKWLAERSESFLSDLHGRDQVSRAELAVDGEGLFLAMRVRTDGNVGAYTSQAGAFIPWFGAVMLTGAYAIPAAYAEIRLAVTNTVPVDAYRGAGRPEAIYLIERLVDKAARELDMDPAEIRRRNFIPPDDFPYRTVTGQVYDSGEYERLLEAALKRADWSGFAGRREDSAAKGRLRGIGLSYYVEICSAMGGEDTHVRFEEDGTVTVLMGTQSTGQGHETSYGQMVAAGLGVPLERIRVLQGDTKTIPTGQGTGGSRSMAIGGSALTRTVETVVESGKKIAAGLLEADAEDIEFEDGDYRIVGTDRTVALPEVAGASFDDAGRPDGVQPGLASTEHFTPEAGTFPNGCHICELEVDPETGLIEILRYTVEDDVGNVINPLILEGQIMGGIAQGLGQALFEEAVYDHDTGQLQTATFMDYTMPRADRLPGIDFHYTEVPSPRNPLGVKGAGEAGTIGAPPALVNAVIDALSPHGIAHLDMPLTPMKVWHAIREARPAA